MSPCNFLCDIHHDIIHTHILYRLNGPALASISCASSQFHILSKEETLWTSVCHSTWPSTMHPGMSECVTKFPNGPRSFLSQCFPPLINITHQTDQDLQDNKLMAPFASPELISAVDIYYKSKPVFSQVHKTVTDTRLFMCSSFRIDLLDSTKDVVRTSGELKKGACRTLLQDLRLSRILVLGGTKAANLSSWKPVSVEQQPVIEDIKLKYSSIISVDRDTDIKCEIIVTLDEYMEFCEVSMQMEDLDGISLNGQKSLEILQKAMGPNRERRKRKRGEPRERHENFVKKVEDSRRSNNKGWRSVAFRAAYFWPVLVSSWICFS